MKNENLRSYRYCMKAGRKVGKGERSLPGLFHVTQTKPIDDRDPGFVDRVVEDQCAKKCGR